MIRYHLDESVRNAIAVGLRSHGTTKPRYYEATVLRSHGTDVTTAAEVGLLGAADEDHIAYALSERRVIVTHDDDFLTLANSGIEHAGICYCHQQKRSIGEVLRTLLVVRECCSQDDMWGHVEFL